MNSEATLDAGAVFLVSKEESLAAPDTGAAANLVCFRLPEHDNQLLGSPPIRRRRGSASKVGASAMFATQKIFRWGSLGIRASSPRSCWKQTFQRHCARAPRGRWAGSWISHVMHWHNAQKGRQFASEGNESGAISLVRSILVRTQRGKCAALWFRPRVSNGSH